VDAGEDRFLVGELAAPMVMGMTSVERNASATLSVDTTVAPLVKHYAVYSIGESGCNAAPAHCLGPPRAAKCPQCFPP
jgi:beta-glucosidase-like glycosyl hydrolase